MLCRQKFKEKGMELAQGSNKYNITLNWIDTSLDSATDLTSCLGALANPQHNNLTYKPTCDFFWIFVDTHLRKLIISENF